jgi:hypothetical protein
MKKAKLYNKSSFLSMSDETDDVDDDDEKIVPSKSVTVNKNLLKKRGNDLELKKEMINFAEVNSNSQSESELKTERKKKKKISDYVYSKPNESMGPDMMNTMKIFRNTQMKELQSRHTWAPSPRESINEKFNKNAASLGKTNTDEFVTFLGFLRDASYRASKIIAENDEKKLNQNLS